MSTVFEFDYANESYIVVSDTGEGFTVTCGDYVANEWIETFSTLSLALLRVATVIKCGEVDWAVGCATDPIEFSIVGESFLNSQVR
jgi:hypothetical protein